MPEEQIYSIQPTVPEKTPGAYISHDAQPSTQPRIHKPKEQIYTNISNKSGEANQSGGTKPVLVPKPPLAPKPSSPKQSQKPEGGKAHPPTKVNIRAMVERLESSQKRS